MELLSEQEVGGLLEALDDEYKAWATYDQVIADLGPVRPFISIRESEGRHIAALQGLCRRYDVPVPENHWIGKVQHYVNIHSACEAAIAAEIGNGALYERLFKSTQRTDILGVFRRLRDASEQRHMPAFQRCASRPGRGRGAGPHRTRTSGQS